MKFYTNKYWLPIDDSNEEFYRFIGHQIIKYNHNTYRCFITNELNSIKF